MGCIPVLQKGCARYIYFLTNFILSSIEVSDEWDYISTPSTCLHSLDRNSFTALSPPPPQSTLLWWWEGAESLGNPLANGPTALIQEENTRSILQHDYWQEEKSTQSLPHTSVSASLSTTDFILTGLEVKPGLLCIRRQWGDTAAASCRNIHNNVPHNLLSSPSIISTNQG